MPIFDSNSLQSAVIHRIGNITTQDGYQLSDSPISLDEQLRDMLLQYFISPFKAEEYFHLSPDDNIVYDCVSQIFDDPNDIVTQSQTIAKHLYEASTHPNIKGGDFFVVYFSECQVNGQITNCVGLFKSENKEQFLKVLHEDSNARFRLEPDKGINVNKLDKGALIFNLEADKGFVVSVVDATNRGSDAQYWRDNFLNLRQREDEYYSTHTELSAYKKFVTDELPQQFEGVTKADQADLLNRSVKYFKQNESFDVQSFANEVIEQPELIESFKQFRNNYQQDNDVALQDSFAISEEAVKKQQRSLKSVIKLDKNFHIYIHGDRQLIEQGEDARGKFYKVYYREES
ncbi:MAG: nucleoid-associated protein [Bacteroidales bacterium]|nr:nucleoid-associated protein [Bacteroidales bacterium]